MELSAPPASQGLYLHELFFEFVSVLPLLLLLVAAHLFTSWRGVEKSQTKTMAGGSTNTPASNMEKPNGKGRESDVKPRETNNLARGSNETNNPTQHGKHKGDDSFNTSTTTAGSQQSPVTSNASAPNNAGETANLDDHGCAIKNCFNNYSGGIQKFNDASFNMSTCENSFINGESGSQAGEIIPTSRSVDSNSNYVPGLQDLSHSKIHISESKCSFINRITGSQILKNTKFAPRDDSRTCAAAAIHGCLINDGIQDYTNTHFFAGPGGGIIEGGQGPDS